MYSRRKWPNIPTPMKNPVSKNLIQELEAEKRQHLALGYYQKAFEVQKRLDFYYYGRIDTK
jgi:hypothetical protein